MSVLSADRAAVSVHPLISKPDKLCLSRARLLQECAVHPGRPYDKLVVGIATFRFPHDSAQNAPHASPEILLLKRAADET